LFKVEDHGRVERKPEGKIVWNPDLGNPKHHRVIPRVSNSEMAGIIEELMARPPKAQVASPKSRIKTEQ